MGTFLLAFLFIVLIPLAEGGLLALFLREVYLKNPLPLGEIYVVITPEEGENNAEWNDSGNPADDGFGGFNESTDQFGEAAILSQLDMGRTPASTVAAETVSPATDSNAPDNTENNAAQGVDVFSDAAEIPDDLPVAGAIDAILAPQPAGRPPADLENLVSAAGQKDEEQLQKLQQQLGQQEDTDESEKEQIEALRSAMPENKIDFGEIQGAKQTDEGISDTAKNLLGENFNVDSLINPPQNETVSADVLEISEPEPGVIQIAGMPAAGENSFATSEVINSSFPADWVQEADVSAGQPNSNLSQFFFSEESRPMFVRKKGK